MRICPLLKCVCIQRPTISGRLERRYNYRTFSLRGTFPLKWLGSGRKMAQPPLRLFPRLPGLFTSVSLIQMKIGGVSEVHLNVAQNRAHHRRDLLARQTFVNSGAFIVLFTRLPVLCGGDLGYRCIRERTRARLAP